MRSLFSRVRHLLPIRANVVAGIDVGSFAVRAVVAKRDPEHASVIIRGRGIVPSRGLRYGYIVNQQAAAKAVREALEEALAGTDQEVGRAFVGVGGTGLDEFRARGEAIVSRPDQVVTAADVAQTQEHALEQLRDAMRNYALLHAFPLRLFADGKEMPVASLEGLRANRIAVEYLFIGAIEKHLNDLIEAVQEAGVEVEGVYASPIAAAHAMLSREQRHIGAALANIGAQTLSLVVYENDRPISLKVFPVGASDITKDIALALQIDPKEAEHIKTRRLATDDETRERVQEITRARMEEMFRLIDRHLQSIQRSRLLPGGIVITGGGSALNQVQDIAKSILALPARVGRPVGRHENPTIAVRDASWAVAYGAVLLGLQEAAGTAPQGLNPTPPLWRTAWEWLRGYLP